MPKARTIWRCQECGSATPRWLGRCSGCGKYGTLVEELDAPARTVTGAAPRPTPVRLSDAIAEEPERLESGILELDCVLGGGFVKGSLVLLGGEPGIGKSTLLLQASDLLSLSGHDVLYVCGEESPVQVGLRARRLSAGGERIRLLSEVDITVLEAAVLDDPPALLVVDSIQTMFDPELTGAPGSVGQVRACTARLVRIAKDRGVTTVIVGHVTKDGSIAGPRVLEHMVDAVLYFEGDHNHAFRVVRAVKNRFGSVSEIGIFEMGAAGLTGVRDPAAVFLGERDTATAGSAVMAMMEGSRPLLVEVQALVTPTYAPVPRRLATGIEGSRLLQVLAVLERHAGTSFSKFDVYASVAGGVRVSEPAIDVPLALALLSAFQGTVVPADIVGFGEISLTGRIRSVPHIEARVHEATRRGLSRVAAVVPASLSPLSEASQLPVETVADLMRLLS